MKKVAILTTGHPPLDERIFNKIGTSLRSNGYEVFIICTTDEIDQELNGIKLSGRRFQGDERNFIKKLGFILSHLKIIEPDIIIACEPIAVLISTIFNLLRKSLKKVRIVYDVTEWYPENIYLKMKGIKRYFYFIVGHIVNFLATNLSNYLFVGEESKLPRYQKYAPKKPYSIISYYPVIEFYTPSEKSITNRKAVFGYAGVISISRGLRIYIELLKSLKEELNEWEFEFIIAGRFEIEDEKNLLTELIKKNIKYTYYDWTDYKLFSKNLEPVHICLDIRPPNKIYERSLPIKIFDYMALGKCIIASDYKPLQEVFRIADCGILVNPLDKNEIIKSTIELIKKPEKIVEYGKNGRSAVEKFFNWKICEIELLKSLERLK